MGLTTVTSDWAAMAVKCRELDGLRRDGRHRAVEPHRFNGYFWEDPTAWLEHSPIMHVGKVTAPTLLMTGELDLRVV